MPLGILPVLSASSERHRLRIHLVAQSEAPAVAIAAGRLAADVAQLTVHPYEPGRSLAACWNDALLRAYPDGADVLLLANDDVVFTQGDVDRLAEAAAANREYYGVTCAGRDLRSGERVPTHGYSCIALNPVALEVVGCFDENFFPAWWEDIDYHRRAFLLGLRDTNCPSTNVLHLGGGSRFLAELTGATVAGNLNERYYDLKWGPQPHYAHPFDDERLDARIDPARRSAPYGRYDRRDGPVRVR